MIAAAFDHWDSRKGDPQLHTHVTIANRVQAPDGEWRTIDSSTLFRAAVAYSETYNQLLAEEVTRRTGLGWETRERGRGRNRRTARELAGVPDSLIAVFSQRSADIEAAVDTAVERHVARTGRQPSIRSLNRIRQHLTLATRDRKKATSLADATKNWHDTARAVLGKNPTDWVRSLHAENGRKSHLTSAGDVTEPVVDAVAARVVDAVAGCRATWTRWNLTAETMRQITAHGWQFNSNEDTVQVRDRIVAAAERLSTSLTTADIAPVPEAFRDPDGTSHFARPAVFTSRQVLAAEDQLLTLAADQSGPRVHPDRADRIAAQVLPGRDFALSAEDQAPAAVGIARSGRIVDLLVGPAGTGKTTCMAGIRAIWEAEYGPGSVLGLAPSAKAAQVLAARPRDRHGQHRPVAQPADPATPPRRTPDRAHQATGRGGQEGPRHHQPGPCHRRARDGDRPVASTARATADRRRGRHGRHLRARRARGASPGGGRETPAGR